MAEEPRSGMRKQVLICEEDFPLPEELKPDVVTLDIEMPEVNGIEVLELKTAPDRLTAWHAGMPWCGPWRARHVHRFGAGSESLCR